MAKSEKFWKMRPRIERKQRLLIEAGKRQKEVVKKTARLEHLIFDEGMNVGQAKRVLANSGGGDAISIDKYLTGEEKDKLWGV